MAQGLGRGACACASSARAGASQILAGVVMVGLTRTAVVVPKIITLTHSTLMSTERTKADRPQRTHRDKGKGRIADARMDVPVSPQSDASSASRLQAGE